MLLKIVLIFFVFQTRDLPFIFQEPAIAFFKTMHRLALKLSKLSTKYLLSLEGKRQTGRN